MMRPEMIVFDMAGTTIEDDHFVAKAFIDAFKQFDIYITEDDVNHLMGYHKPEAIKIVLVRAGMHSKELVEVIHAEFEKRMLHFYLYSTDLKAIAGAEELFFSLKQLGIKVTLNTGFSRKIAEVILSRLKWIENGLVDDLIASDEVQAGRPFPYMIEELTRRNNIKNKDSIIKVGDTPVDILEGKNAGCYTIAVTTGASSKDELQSYSPDHIISDLSELKTILNGSISNYA